jgi:large subunit ribosomal protein L21
MFVILESGGKQYKVSEGDKIKISKTEALPDKPMIFDKVLLVDNDGVVTVGKPYIDGATVEAKLVRQGRDKKKIVFKYHAKSRYRKMKGHRQHFTEAQITKISK